MRDIRFSQSSPRSDRRHFVDEEDVRVVLSRLPAETYERLEAVHFDDRGDARRFGYVRRGRRAINLCAQPPRLSASGARGVKPEAFGAIRGAQWPALAVRRFLLYDTFLHELGHLQLIHPGEREYRRRFAVEPRAEEFADTWRERLWSTSFDHPDPAHNPPSAVESAAVVEGWARSHAAYKRGLAAEKTAHSDEATTAYEEAIDRYPWHALALERLGCRAYGREDFERACELLNRAIAVDRRLFDANLFLALALGRLGRRDEARAQFERVQRIAESRRLANFGLATFADCLRKWGATEESERLFRAVLAKEPDMPPYLRGYARVVWARDQREARSLLERAVELDPEDPISHCHFAAALADLGETARAKEHLEIALRLRPAYARAAKLLQELDR